ncbi:LOW QUALITY PROTEIN: cell division cycle-associated protein 2 [Corvus moneduloides]|uniref:LOW QUALITY PROTEIN: cell division cycle-associated protein 2 n=1 Tax=Corvus moneduloides TaxID=1196302 RepID=UPI0013638375|nr:LOW QUALITY PROTEIN: cell division cycle-associated protein 2 [Corvus moneduloides]
MLRGSKTPLKVKENESGCPEEKKKASFPLSKDQKSCKVTKSKVIRPSKEENFTDGSQTRPQKRALKCPKGPEEDSCHPRGVGVSWQPPGSCFGALGGEVLSEPPLPLDTKQDFSCGQAVPLGNYFYSTPERDKVEPDFGLCEQRKRPVDSAAVTTAEFGIAQESCTKRPTGTSPASLKFRRRSTIGLRGSPENNTLIRYLAQHRSSRQKEAFTQISPFKHANVRSLKDKIDAFQTSFGSLQEAEGEASQEGGSSQNKAPFKKEPNLEQWSEEFILGNRGAALKENLSENGTKSSRSGPRICSILSPQRAVTVTGPAAAKEWVYEQQNPIKSLETAVTGDILETGHGHRCGHSAGGTGSDALADLSTRKVGFVEGVSLGMLDGSQAPVTPPRTGNIPSSDLSQSGSLLRSILKKTPGRELVDSSEEYSNSAIDRGGGGSAAVSDCVKAFETLQAERTESQSSKTPKKKKVTFGEVLSPEIFDQTLPANTPLHRGASPGCPQGQSPCARPGLSEEPLPQLDFGWDDEGVEPLQEFLEGSVAVETPSPVENAEVAETDKPDMITLSSTKRRQCRAVAEDADCGSLGATNTENDKDTKNPRRSKIQRQKNPTTAAPKKTQKTKYPSYGRRRKKKVKKSLYGEREMASKKPLLSPILEIPEVFSSVSSPNSPKADALFTEGAGLGDPKSRNACKDTPQEPVAGRVRGKELCAAAVCPGPGLLEEAAATSSGTGDSEVPGSLECAPGTAAEFSKTVPDAEGDLDTSEYFQPGEETPREKEAKESSSLLEKEESQGNLLRGLEILEQQDVQEGAQRTECPQKDSVRGDPARRRRRSGSAFYFPPAGNLEVPGTGVAVSCYSVEEVLSAPRPKEGSPQPCRRKSSAGAEGRVRRSMRLSKDAASEGLAWVQLLSEIPKQPPLPAAAPKARRSISTSILAGSENIHHREQNLLRFPAPGKENEGSAPPAAGPGRRGRRRSLVEATARKTPWAPTQRRRNTNSGCGKDRSNQKHSEEAETLELQLKEVSGSSDFLK